MCKHVPMTAGQYCTVLKKIELFLRSLEMPLKFEKAASQEIHGIFPKSERGRSNDLLQLLSFRDKD